MMDIFLNRARDLLALDRVYKRLLVIFIDALICIAAAQLSFSLRLGEWQLGAGPVLIFTLTALAIWFPIAYLSNVYLVVFRFAGSGTLLSLFKASIGFAMPILVIFGLYGIAGIPRTVAAIHPILFFGGLALSRIVMRYVLVDLLDTGSRAQSFKRVLIYGAGNSGRQLAASLRHDGASRLIGYADDSANLIGQRIDGKLVFAGDDLEHAIAQNKITDVLIAMPNSGRQHTQKIVRRLSELSVSVKVLPSVGKMLDGEVQVSDLRAVSIEDLLGRAAVNPDNSLLQQSIAGRTVMITGAGGSIGSELCRQIFRHQPKQLILAEMSELALYLIEQELNELREDAEFADIAIIPQLVNLANHDQVNRLFHKWPIEVIFHAAAYKHVPLVESNPLSGLRNNIFGTFNMARAAEQAGIAKFILISTDKAVRPTNIMGATKRACELVLQAFAAKPGQKTVFAMVRFGNVLGSSGSVVPRFLAQIRSGGPVTLTDQRITRYFMTIPEAAQLVVQAGAMAGGGEVFLLDMGKSIRIADLAKSMINLSGLSVRSPENPDGDIEITEIGLRPGEKLYEELLIDADADKTGHERIMKAHEKFLPWDELEAHLHTLDIHIEHGERAKAIALLGEIVPEYQPDTLRGAEQLTEIAETEGPALR